MTLKKLFIGILSFWLIINFTAFNVYAYEKTPGNVNIIDLKNYTGDKYKYDILVTQQFISRKKTESSNSLGLAAVDSTKITSYKYGDVDGNGIVTGSDYNYLKDYILSGSTLPAINGEFSGDIDNDGKITSRDCSYLNKYLKQKIKAFPSPDSFLIVEVDDVYTCINQNSSFIMPKTTTAIRADGSRTSIAVSWTKTQIDTSKPGNYSLQGTVNGITIGIKMNYAIESDESIFFPDSTLEKIIREIINKSTGNISKSELAQVEYLLYNTNELGVVQSLEGIQYLPNLLYVQFYNYDNTVIIHTNDLSPLKALTYLQALEIDNSAITDKDIEALSSNKQLKYLTLINDGINSLVPFANLNNIQGLSLWDNNISNIQPLQNLTNLNYLNLNYNNIGDLSPLKDMKNLEILGLADNNINDLGMLSGLCNLKELYLSNNKISDINALKNLSKLEWVDLSNNNISNIDSLSNLVNLKTLVLAFNKIKDISPLKNLLNLETLSLQSLNFLPSSMGIGNLSHGQTLPDYDYTNNLVTDVGPLKDLKKLDILFLSDNPITANMEVLKGLPLINNDNPWFLWCGANKVDDAIKIQNKCNEIIQSIINPSMTEFEKVKAIHDYIVMNVDYDYNFNWESYEAIGALLQNKAVCQGYSSAFRLLCQMAGINCLMATSDTHGWNIVMIDGEWYHIDTTWDTKYNNAPTYYYFLLTDDQISKIQYHDTWQKDKYPKCTSTKYNYINGRN